MNDLHRLSLDFDSLTQAYTQGLTLRALIDEVYRRIKAGDRHIWLYLAPKEEILRRAEQSEQRRACGENLPLYGLPYGVQDNIDVVGMPTTSGCPLIAYTPSRSAAVVERLDAAGALLLGKQNLDQLATGHVGIRTVVGHCANAFDARYVPGGSSSGSAVAVAVGQVAFSIGSDTGGSGRVPAACNNVVGLKPTPGRVSTRGFIYNNRSFDVASIFALTVDDAYRVFAILDGHDTEDIYSIPTEERPLRETCGLLEPFAPFDFVVPQAEQLEFFGDGAAEQQFSQALSHLLELGGRLHEIDFAPFLEAGRMIFESSLIVERWLTYRNAIERHPENIHPIVRAAIEQARRYDAADVFADQYRLRALQAIMRETMRGRLLITPTIGTLPRCDDVEADPIHLNTRMGYYTCFANPLGMTAISVPAGLTPNGLPFGISIAAERFGDTRIGALASAFERRIGGNLGASAASVIVKEAT